MTAPVLVFGYGNPSRGDDALGPEFVRRLEQNFAHELEKGQLEVLTDYQLQIEHALDLKGRKRVFFVDASAKGESVEVRPVSAVRDPTFTTHLLSPQALLHTFEEVEQQPAPPAWTIAIPGVRFELGEPMSEAAIAHLDVALADFRARW